MFAIALALVAAAFPVRGNRLVAVDSNLILDNDTLHSRGACFSGACQECSYSFTEFTKTGATSPFPGDTPVSNRFAVDIGWSSQVPSWSPESICRVFVRAYPKIPSKTIYRGERTWALQADTIRYRIESINNVDGTPVKEYSIVAKPVLVRWSWSAYDSTLPLVRWLDTVRIAPDDSTPRGTPVYTLRDSLQIDSITPVLPITSINGLELRFDVRKDTIMIGSIIGA